MEPLLRLPPAIIVEESASGVSSKAEAETGRGRDTGTGADAGSLILVNVSAICAIGLMAMERDPEQFVHFDRNMVILLPGERLQMNWAIRNLKEGSEFSPTIEGLNVEADRNGR